MLIAGPREKAGGRAYLRRSDGRQETSLETQLTWAISAAARHGVPLQATAADLAHMKSAGLHSFKDIRLDDSVSGTALDRPGLNAFVADALSNDRISHGFIYLRDRLGRPDSPLEMMKIELSLSRAGITLVFNDAIVEPPKPGEDGLAHYVQMLFGYHESGQYVKKLADRIIATHVGLVAAGFRTGGNAPYGFARVLVGSDGTVLEELSPGRTVRQAGCHVKIRMKDPEKIRIWVYILELAQNWGSKRIAAHLNKLGIPSPGAGTFRTDQGVRHLVSGRWSPGEVAFLIRHRAIIGVQEYGRRSQGKVRRLGLSGPRPVTAADFIAAERPKTILNDDSLVRSGATGEVPQYDLGRWQDLQDQVTSRGASQKGVPRASDLAKYPLSCRVIDLTAGCHSPMYGVTSGNRRLYKCGLYMRTAGAECHHNQVDAEALLRVVLQILSRTLNRHGNRQQLRRLLEERAQAEAETANPPGDPAMLEKASTERSLATLQGHLTTVGRRMATEVDDVVQAELRQQFKQLKAELVQAEARVAEANARGRTKTSTPTEEVDAAMRLVDDLLRLSGDDESRKDINPRLRRIGAWVGLHFVQAVKGKTRMVRRLAGGVVTFGGEMPPVALFGPRNAEPAGGGGHEWQQGSPTCALSGSEGAASVENSADGCACESSSGHQESISLTKVNRGDWI